MSRPSGSGRQILRRIARAAMLERGLLPEFSAAPEREASAFAGPARAAHARQLVICSGGGAGIMEAANRGAADAGGKTIGLNIRLPREQHPNPYITRELLFEFHYFFMRKLWFAHLARALVAFPGGFGTLDELTEILTLAQTRKLSRDIPVILFGTQYWREIVDFEALVRHGMVSPEDLTLFEYADEPSAALGILKRRLAVEPGEGTPGFAHSHHRR